MVVNCSNKCRGKVRGRPLGTELSEYSINNISIGRQGKKHKEETKQKIKESLNGAEYYYPKKSRKAISEAAKKGNNKTGNPLFRKRGKEHPRHRDYGK